MAEYFMRLYVHPAWRKGDEVYSEVLYPFWGIPGKLAETHPQVKELFESFPFDSRCYGITENISEADAVFPPYTQAWLLRRHPDLLLECSRVAQEAGLPLFMDGRADGEPSINTPNTYCMRIGGYRFDKREKGRIEIAVPTDDLLARYKGGSLAVRRKSDGAPVVGFAGMVKMSPTAIYQELGKRKLVLQELPYYLCALAGLPQGAKRAGLFWRRKAVRILERSPKITANFKIRSFFSGSSLSVPLPISQLQQEMVDIITGSDYALDVRGFANASTRLFEILSLGRIPVIIDTERILPFSDEVDWKSFSLIVDFRDLKRLPDIIADFHANIKPEKFESMQRAARDAYVKYFRTDAEMPHIVKRFIALSAASKNRKGVAGIR